MIFYHSLCLGQILTRLPHSSQNPLSPDQILSSSAASCSPQDLITKSTTGTLFARFGNRYRPCFTLPATFAFQSQLKSAYPNRFDPTAFNDPHFTPPLLVLQCLLTHIPRATDYLSRTEAEDPDAQQSGYPLQAMDLVTSRKQRHCQAKR